MTPASFRHFASGLIEAVLKQSGPAHARRAELAALKLGQDAQGLIPHGYQIFSQNEEDGMIAEIFRRIGVAAGTFVELGAGNGLENNTAALLFQGWRGLWVEGSPQLVRRIERALAPVLARGQLTVRRAFLTRENVAAVVGGGFSGELDLLSIDLDGNDLYLFEALAALRPRVAVFEYNPKFPPPIAFRLPYDPAHRWQEDDYYGASLQTLAEVLAAREYLLVGCDATGTNAFFVRRDLAGDHFLAPFTAGRHYQPPRPHLSRIPGGHRSSYRTLAAARASRAEA